MLSRNFLLLASFTVAAHASSTYVLPNADTNTQGGQADAIPLGNSNWEYQWIFDPGSISIPIGAEITGIGFRLDTGDSNGPRTAITIPNWDLELSSSPNSVSTLSATYANNIGTDAVTVYSGALTIPALALKHTGNTYPFYVINFITPFIYEGTNLLFTLHRDGDSSTSNLWVDGVFPTSPASVSNTVGDPETFTTGVTDFFAYPVTELVFSTTPEPSSWLLLGTGLIALLLRRR